jgi:hypothetical protein
MDEITSDVNRADWSSKKRRLYTLCLLLGTVGGLICFVAVAFWYFKRVDAPPPGLPPSIRHSVLLPTGYGLCGERRLNAISVRTAKYSKHKV